LDSKQSDQSPIGQVGECKVLDVDTILKMNLTIYGIMDSTNNWFRELNKTSKELGHHQLRANSCIQIHHSDLGYTIASTYTDDVANRSSSTAAVIKVRKDLSTAYEITDLGHPNKCLGILITLDDTTSNIALHQITLIKKVIDIFGMSEANLKYTPLLP
jgi:hypothetical protein